MRTSTKHAPIDGRDAFKYFAVPEPLAHNDRNFPVQSQLFEHAEFGPFFCFIRKLREPAAFLFHNAQSFVDYVLFHIKHRPQADRTSPQRTTSRPSSYAPSRTRPASCHSEDQKQASALCRARRKSPEILLPAHAAPFGSNRLASARSRAGFPLRKFAGDGLRSERNQ